MVDHHEAVQQLYAEVEEKVDESDYWDDVFKELDYYENDTCPVGQAPDNKGQMKGEFDVIAVNYDKRNGVYYELKTNPAHTPYAREQLERAESHFDAEIGDDSDWSILGEVVVER